MLEEEIFDKIKNSNLFSELTKSQIHLLANAVSILDYKKGEVIFAEDDNSRDLFYIVSGNVELCKTSDGKNVGFKKLDNGNFFGEMSFIDNSPRSAHVIAISKTSLIKFNYEIIKRISPELLTIVTSKIYTLIMNRLKESNSSNVKNIEAKLDHLQFQQEFGYFFVALIAAISLSSFLHKIFDMLYSAAYNNTFIDIIYSWVYLFVSTLPFLYLFYTFKYKLTELGVNKKNLYSSLGEALFISFSIIILVYMFYENIVSYTSDFQKENYAANVTTIFFVLKLITYLFHSTIQEFIARGMVQNSIRRFLSDKSGVRSVMLTSIIFAAGHLHITIGFALVTFILSTLLGFLFLRHKNIWGVSIVHFCIGAIGIKLGLL